MISTRFVPALGVLLFLALVPTVIHNYMGLTVDDGHTATAARVEVAGLSSAPTARTAAWTKKNFDTDNWFEQRYSNSTTEVVLYVARSYDLKRLYHHPEIALARGTDYRLVGIEYLKDKPDIPITRLEFNGEGQRAVALYALWSDGGFIADPVMFQIRTAGRLIFSGRRPLTLLFAQQRNVSGTETIDELAATKILFSAIDGFLAHKVDAAR